jgi:hypothetical protein
MPRLEYFLASESLSVDMNSNTISVYHILNEVFLDEMPGRLPMLAVVAAWIYDEAEIRDKKEFQAKIELQLPGSETKLFRTNMKAMKRFSNIHLQILDVAIEKSGDLVIKMILDDEEKASHTIAVSRIGD